MLAKREFTQCLHNQPRKPIVQVYLAWKERPMRTDMDASIMKVGRRRLEVVPIKLFREPGKWSVGEYEIPLAPSKGPVS
jgi:hypothetical protein